MNRRLIFAFAVFICNYASAQKSGSKEKLMLFRLQFKVAEYCMGAVYNGGFMGLQSGIRAEAYLLHGKLIPEVQYNHGWVDMEKFSFPNDVMKPFSDIRVGVRIGKFQPGKSTFRNLHCIDRIERDGNIETTYYEDEEVHGDRHIGLTGGMYMSRAFLNSAFTAESGIDGSVSVNSQSLYIGLALTKMIDNKAKEYKSGNTCIWDKYSYFYGNLLVSVNHTIGDMYYVGGVPSAIAGTQTYPAYAGVQDKLRAFVPYGFVLGFEGGRWRRGFVGNYELGMIPSLKGKGVYFKVGASFALGVG